MRCFEFCCPCILDRSVLQRLEPCKLCLGRLDLPARTLICGQLIHRQLDLAWVCRISRIPHQIGKLVFSDLQFIVGKLDQSRLRLVSFNSLQFVPALFQIVALAFEPRNFARITVLDARETIARLLQTSDFPVQCLDPAVRPLEAGKFVPPVFERRARRFDFPGLGSRLDEQPGQLFFTLLDFGGKRRICLFSLGEFGSGGSQSSGLLTDLCVEPIELRLCRGSLGIERTRSCCGGIGRIGTIASAEAERCEKQQKAKIHKCKILITIAYNPFKICCAAQFA